MITGVCNHKLLEVSVEVVEKSDVTSRGFPHKTSLLLTLRFTVLIIVNIVIWTWFLDSWWIYTSQHVGTAAITNRIWTCFTSHTQNKISIHPIAQKLYTSILDNIKHFLFLSIRQANTKRQALRKIQI